MGAVVPSLSPSLRTLTLAMAVVSLVCAAGGRLPTPLRAQSTAPTPMAPASPSAAVPVQAGPEGPATAAPQDNPRADAPPGFPPPVASYDIDAALDPAAHRITGRARITFTNPGQVPAYSLPDNLTDVSGLRIVVRNGFGRDLADLLLDDLKRATDFLEGLDAELPHDPSHTESFRH